MYKKRRLEWPKATYGTHRRHVGLMPSMNPLSGPERWRRKMGLSLRNSAVRVLGRGVRRGKHRFRDALDGVMHSGHFSQGLPSKLFPKLGKRLPVAMAQPHAACDPLAQDTVFGDQICVANQEVLVYITGSVDQDLLVRMDVLVATDFFTTEVWTQGGLLTYDALIFTPLGSRWVHIASVTPHPHAPWMMRIARNMTMADWGFLEPGQYLIYDRDGKFCPAFQQIIDDARHQTCGVAATEP